MGDYAPAEVFDDEDEEQLRRRNGGYAPAIPAPAPPVAVTSDAPAVGSTEDLEARAAQPRVMPAAAPVPLRPQWKGDDAYHAAGGHDYAPAEPHGWSAVGHNLAALFPNTNRVFNTMPEQRAENSYNKAVAEYQAPIAEQHTEAETEHAQAQSELERAQAKVAGQPKPKEEKWDPLPGYTDTDGTPLLHEANSGQVMRASDKKPPTGFQATKTEKPDNAEQQFVEEYQKNNPKATVAQAQHAFKQNETVAEPGNFMPLYDEKGHVSGAWDPKSGRIVKTPEGALPGNTSQGSVMAEKSEERNTTATATVNSFTRYQQSFHDLSPQLTPQDREAMQVLTSHQEKIAEGFLGAAQSGILDTLIGQPLTGYSQKLMGGAMTKDQYDKLSPAGKKMLADYFNAVVQNFGNMKQIMGSVGRNPIQLLAEINTIPLPYLDAQSAETMFKDKLDDLHQRNPNLAKSESAVKGGAEEAPEGTRIQVGDKTQVKRNGKWVPEQP